MIHRKHLPKIAWTLGLIALLASCSSISLNGSERVERTELEAYAGQPVDHFTWLGDYQGWKPVSADEALVWTTPTKAYLIKVSPACEDLRSASRIGLTSTLHTVYARKQDYVKVRGERCPIAQIRPVDYGRLQANVAKTDARGS